MSYFVRKLLLDEGYGKTMRSSIPGFKGCFRRFKMGGGGGAARKEEERIGEDGRDSLAAESTSGDLQWRPDLLHKARALAQCDSMCDKFITTCMGQRYVLVGDCANV